MASVNGCSQPCRGSPLQTKFRSVFVVGKKRCSDCKRKELELAEKRVMDSWLCEFSDDEVWCPHSEIPQGKRRRSVCPNCEHFRKAMREMEEEDEEVMDAIDEIQRNPEEYGT